jgi:AmmeMemoRadiSam system protein A
MSKLSESPSETHRELELSAPARACAELSPEQRRILLAIAHQAILAVVEQRPLTETPPPVPGLSEPRGVFTTLYLRLDDFPSDSQEGREPESHRELRHEPRHEPRRVLRGCVGYALPIVPLYRAVAETAHAAAFEDSRFAPVTAEEAGRLEVSLSVLSPLFPIHPEAVEVGRHGLIVSQGPRRGLLLPQVPVEHGWDRTTFLEQTCRKAGLPLDAWRKATIEAFTAEVFSDGDLDPAC